MIIIYTAKGDGDDKTKAKKVLSSFRQDTQVYDIANGDQSDKVVSSGAKRNRGKAEETSKQEYDVVSSQKDDRIKLKPNIVYRLGKGKDKDDEGYVNEGLNPQKKLKTKKKVKPDKKKKNNLAEYYEGGYVNEGLDKK